MTWLLWRQHRGQSLVAALLFAAFGILLWITGVHMAGEYHSALAGCRPTGSCDDLNLFQGDGALVDLVSLSAAVPLLVGLFWGVTGLGRELETGTHQLVWLQSVRVRDWLRDKVGFLLLAALVWGAAVSAVVTWWSGTLNALEGNRFDPGKFDTQGIVPVAYALFGVALGLAAGAVLRRLLPALAVTAGVFVAVRLAVVAYVRPYYRPARTAAQSIYDNVTSLPRGSWVLSRQITLNGHPVSKAFLPAESCQGLGSRGAVAECLQHNGWGSVVTYQPASRYWTFQWIETGLFVALAAVLVAVAIVAVRKRDG